MAISSSSPSSDPGSLRFPEWQGFYHAAVLETNRHKLLRRVQAAENAILKRLEALPETSENFIKRQAIFDAVGTLRFLRLEAEKPSTSSRKLA
jgi:hypothetical protein